MGCDAIVNAGTRPVAGTSGRDPTAVVTSAIPDLLTSSRWYSEFNPLRHAEAYDVQGMLDPHEAELRIAVAQGILSREESEAFAEAARRKAKSPLVLLAEAGRLSATAFEALRREALNATAPMHDQKPFSSAASSGTAFPVNDWERYSSVRFLGQGGMGKVFLAFDPRLQRQVAIKFVLGNDPEYVRRLIAEARAQARVTHENVCKVHEVGEVDGKVFIAMQYIDGRSLGDLADDLTVRQKVMLLRGAAEGIHEAHRAGIVHRDIKPSNIMVERKADGELKPYVVDFGIAYAVQEGGVTQTGTGAVVGTPRYMAPEQARGAASKIDRRADVYSLGATLYHLLLGEPPIPGTNVVEVLHHLSNSEPRRPRAIDPDLPADLEAIVLRCLEKDRSARYDSARALADDLSRFLDGEPVDARAAGAGYHLRKWIQKHRRLVAASAVVLVLFVAAVAWGIANRLEAGTRERLARRFTERVEHIEALARYAALSPVHDIRGDRARIRAAMAELGDEIQQAGSSATGPGHYALGRGFLVLDDDARAQGELEAAWQDGFREPRAAYALALVLGHQYQQGLLAAERIEHKETREATKRKIERDYRDPALTYLAASRGAEVPSTDYVAALVAFYEGRLEQALEHLDAIGVGLPWFYEAAELRGDILLARAWHLCDQGDRDQARKDFEAGRRAYASAAAIGESVPTVYRSLGELEYLAMVMELYGEGEVAPPYQRLVAATERALAILPGDPASLVLEARAHRAFAEHEARRGRNADALLTKALADARRAFAADPSQPQAPIEIASIYRQRGEALQGRNRDPSEELEKAVETSGAILPKDRDATYYVNLGLIFTIWADYDEQVGADPDEHRGHAIAADSKAILLDDKRSDVWIHLGISFFKRGSQPHGADPDGDLRQAIRALEQARSINPKHVVPFFYEGLVYERMAARTRAHGRDATVELDESLRMFEAGLAINPKLPQLQNGSGAVFTDQAKVAWDLGRDPEPFLDRARAAFERAIAAAPDQGFGYANVGETFAQKAWLQRARGEDPSASVHASVDALKQAIERIPDDATFWSDLGMAHALQAADELERDREPQARLALAAEALHSALEKNPKDAQATLYLGETRAIHARWEARRGRGKVEDLEQTAETYERAIELAPEGDEARIAFGHFCRARAEIERAAARDPGPSLRRGFELADKVLAIRPAIPDARILRASLYLVRAESAKEAALRREDGARADADFTAALTTNPALEGAWKNQVKLARQLASSER